MNHALEVLANKKDKVFLISCLCVHLGYFCYFLSRGATEFYVLNGISSIIYIFLLVLNLKDNDTNIVIAFFEIMFFSVISELMASGSLGYIYFPLGMVAVIFYLVNLERKQTFLLQSVGVITTILIFFIEMGNLTVPFATKVNFDEHRPYIKLTNILVALVIMLYVSLLYRREQEENRATIEYNMNHDQLTGLYNRRFFYSYLQTRDRVPGEYSVAMIDIDNFKKINDKNGHTFGDAALISLALLMNGSVKPEDIVVRWGGEEFLIFFPETDIQKAEIILQEMQGRIRENETCIGEQKIRFTVTMGLANGHDLLEYEEVIGEADKRLYQGKNSGKNKIVAQ